MRLRLKSVAVACLLLASATPASAAKCSVAAVSVAFGNYDPFRPGPTDTTGNIAVTCTGKLRERVAYSIALNTGSSGTFAARQMKSARGVLSYNIYTTAARAIVWGDGNKGSSVVSDSFALTAASVTKNYPPYGRAFAAQKVTVGTYTDSLVITLNF